MCTVLLTHDLCDVKFGMKYSYCDPMQSLRNIA